MAGKKKVKVEASPTAGIHSYAGFFGAHADNLGRQLSATLRKPDRRPRMAPEATEHQIQAAFIQGIELLTPQHPVLKLSFAVPNGGLRSKATAGKLKAEGVRAGVPDWCLPHPSSRWNGLWIEFKAKRGAPSENQLKFHQDLRDFGHRVEIHRDPDAALQAVMSYLRGE